MQMRKRGQGIGFTDLLFNALIGMMLLFIIALTMINPIAEEGDIDHVAEIIIRLTWSPQGRTDLDTWVLGPGMKRPMSYQNKEADYITLDRDDLGGQNDTVRVGSKVLKIESNQEIAAIRGVPDGWYYVSINIFRLKPSDMPENSEYQVEIIDLNPSATIVYRYEGNYEGKKREMPRVAFKVLAGQVVDIDEGKAKGLIRRNRGATSRIPG